MKGYVHLYCGDGKGKTSAAIGLAVRAAGRGKRILVVRFLKTEDSGEVEILRRIPGITVTPCDREFGFISSLTQEQRQEAAVYFRQRFQNAAGMLTKEAYDVAVFDELIPACSAGMVQESEVIRFLTARPEGLEVVLTGRGPSRELEALADYISEIQMKKHPYTKGVCAREGIEY